MDSSSSDLSGRNRLSCHGRRGRSRASSSRPGPIPTSGSAIFTFDSALNRPRITTYFTVVFQEESQVEDFRTQAGSSGAIPNPSSSFQLATENSPQQETNEQMGRAQEVMMVDLGPVAQHVTQTEELPDMGWCRIIEEPLDE